jgi:hypothetical protein
MSDLLIIDGIGFAAAGLVLATFCMHSMSGLRWMAIASNVAFIAYGYLEHLAPVLLLHVLLLPVNSYRLAQLYGGQTRSKPTEERSKHALAPLNRNPLGKPTLAECRTPDSSRRNAEVSAARVAGIR